LRSGRISGENLAWHCAGADDDNAYRCCFLLGGVIIIPPVSSSGENQKNGDDGAFGVASSLEASLSEFPKVEVYIKRYDEYK